MGSYKAGRSRYSSHIIVSKTRHALIILECHITTILSIVLTADLQVKRIKCAF